VAAPAVDTTAPTVSTYSPSDAATGVAVGSNIVLTFSEAIQKGTGAIVIHSGSATGTAVATYDAATSGNLAVSGSTLTINPTADLATGTQYFVTFDAGSIKDLAGNSYTGTATYDFTTVAAPAVDTTAPTVSTYSPSDAATGVAVGSNIVLTFSEAIQKGTGAIVIHSGSATGTAVATYDAATSGNLAVSGSTLTINPTADLATGTQYFVTLAAGSIKDLAGNGYTGTTTYDFTTVAAPAVDTTAPTVSTYSPSDAATGVAVGSNIVLTFSEAIQKGTGAIVIHSGSATGTAVATYDAATSGNLAVSGSTLTINPTADLATGTQYFVTLAAGSIKDLAGNGYTGTTTYDFTTALPSVVDTTAPTVSSYSPSIAATGVVVGSNIVLTFSEAIQKGSGAIVIHSGSAIGTTVATYDAATSGNLSVSGSTLTINPTTDFAAGTEYFVTLDAGAIKDLSGNNFAAQTGSYHFTTGGTFVMVAGSLESWEYLASYPDLMNWLGTDVATAAWHYNNFGAAEGRSIRFDAWDYLASNDDLMNWLGADVQKAAVHYITHGRNENRSFAFDAASYLSANQDLALWLGKDYDAAARHYIEHGRFEMAKGFRPSFSEVFLTPPAVIGYAPADAASGVAVGSDIVLTFSEAIQKGSGTIVIHSGSATGTTVASYDVASSGNLAVSGNTLTINPTADLAHGTHYFVTLDAGSIKDFLGNSYVGTSAYDFTTVLAADTTAPTVLSYKPSDAATGVAVGSNIVLTFSEAIQKGSGTIVIHSGSATGTPVESFDVATSGNLVASGNTLTINPTADLATGTQYFVTMNAGSIKDLAGNGYTGTTTCDFTTVAPLDTTAPTVSSYNPSDAATGVAIGSDIVLTFSEAIQKGSGTIVIHSGSATGAVVESYDVATSGNLALSDNTLTINPTADLANSTHYFVTLNASSIKDFAGNGYAGTNSYDFATVASADNNHDDDSHDSHGIVLTGISTPLDGSHDAQG